MSEYLICVMHPAGTQAAGSVYADEAAMQAAFERVGEFNDQLSAEGRLVTAAGLLPPDRAVSVDPTGGGDPVVTDGPVDTSDHALGGFWLVRADSDEQARETLVKAAKACGQRLELRRLAD